MDSSSAINSASNIQMDYMKLLITQLQNQNPLEPMDNNQMASQLAQFSQLQQLESMNSNFANVLSSTERNYANSLIGKEIPLRLRRIGMTSRVCRARLFVGQETRRLLEFHCRRIRLTKGFEPALARRGCTV